MWASITVDIHDRRASEDAVFARRELTRRVNVWTRSGILLKFRLKSGAPCPSRVVSSRSRLRKAGAPMEKWRTEGWPSVAEWRKAVERHRRACSKARAEQRELPPPPVPPALGLPPTQPAERLALAELPSNTITGSEGHAGDRCRSIVKRSTTASRAFDKPWSELAENERAAVQRLGFDATTWDTVVGAEPSTAWLLLPSEQREAAILRLGIHRSGGMQTCRLSHLCSSLGWH